MAQGFAALRDPLHHSACTIFRDVNPQDPSCIPASRVQEVLSYFNVDVPPHVLDRHIRDTHGNAASHVSVDTFLTIARSATVTSDTTHAAVDLLRAATNFSPDALADLGRELGVSTAEAARLARTMASFAASAGSVDALTAAIAATEVRTGAAAEPHPTATPPPTTSALPSHTRAPSPPPRDSPAPVPAACGSASRATPHTAPSRPRAPARTTTAPIHFVTRATVPAGATATVVVTTCDGGVRDATTRHDTIRAGGASVPHTVQVTRTSALSPFSGTVDVATSFVDDAQLIEDALANRCGGADGFAAVTAVAAARGRAVGAAVTSGTSVHALRAADAKLRVGRRHGATPGLVGGAGTVTAATREGSPTHSVSGGPHGGHYPHVSGGYATTGLWSAEVEQAAAARAVAAAAKSGAIPAAAAAACARAVAVAPAGAAVAALSYDPVDLLGANGRLLPIPAAPQYSGGVRHGDVLVAPFTAAADRDDAERERAVVAALGGVVAGVLDDVRVWEWEAVAGTAGADDAIGPLDGDAHDATNEAAGVDQASAAMRCGGTTFIRGTDGAAANAVAHRAQHGDGCDAVAIERLHAENAEVAALSYSVELRPYGRVIHALPPTTTAWDEHLAARARERAAEGQQVGLAAYGAVASLAPRDGAVAATPRELERATAAAEHDEYEARYFAGGLSYLSAKFLSSHVAPCLTGERVTIVAGRAEGGDQRIALARAELAAAKAEADAIIAAAPPGTVTEAYVPPVPVAGGAVVPRDGETAQARANCPFVPNLPAGMGEGVRDQVFGEAAAFGAHALLASTPGGPLLARLPATVAVGAANAVGATAAAAVATGMLLAAEHNKGAGDHGGPAASGVGAHAGAERNSAAPVPPTVSRRGRVVDADTMLDSTVQNTIVSAGPNGTHYTAYTAANTAMDPATVAPGGRGATTSALYGEWGLVPQRVAARLGDQSLLPLGDDVAVSALGLALDKEPLRANVSSVAELRRVVGWPAGHRGHDPRAAEPALVALTQGAARRDGAPCAREVRLTPGAGALHGAKSSVVITTTAGDNPFVYSGNLVFAPPGSGAILEDSTVAAARCAAVDAERAEADLGGAMGAGGACAGGARGDRQRHLDGTSAADATVSRNGVVRDAVRLDHYTPDEYAARFGPVGLFKAAGVRRAAHRGEVDVHGATHGAELDGHGPHTHPLYSDAAGAPAPSCDAVPARVAFEVQEAARANAARLRAGLSYAVDPAVAPHLSEGHRVVVEVSTERGADPSAAHGMRRGIPKVHPLPRNRKVGDGILPAPGAWPGQAAHARNVRGVPMQNGNDGIGIKGGDTYTLPMSGAPIGRVITHRHLLPRGTDGTHPDIRGTADEPLAPHGRHVRAAVVGRRDATWRHALASAVPLELETSYRGCHTLVHEVCPLPPNASAPKVAPPLPRSEAARVAADEVRARATAGGPPPVVRQVPLTSTCGESGLNVAVVAACPGAVPAATHTPRIGDRATVPSAPVPGGAVVHVTRTRLGVSEPGFGHVAIARSLATAPQRPVGAEAAYWRPLPADRRVISGTDDLLLLGRADGGPIAEVSPPRPPAHGVGVVDGSGYADTARGAAGYPAGGYPVDSFRAMSGDDGRMYEVYGGTPQQQQQLYPNMHGPPMDPAAYPPAVDGLGPFSALGVPGGAGAGSYDAPYTYEPHPGSFAHPPQQQDGGKVYVALGASCNDDTHGAAGPEGPIYGGYDDTPPPSGGNEVRHDPYAGQPYSDHPLTSFSGYGRYHDGASLSSMSTACRYGGI